MYKGLYVSTETQTNCNNQRILLKNTKSIIRRFGNVIRIAKGGLGENSIPEQERANGNEEYFHDNLFQKCWLLNLVADNEVIREIFNSKRTKTFTSTASRISPSDGCPFYYSILENKIQPLIPLYLVGKETHWFEPCFVTGHSH